jgi:hypothetical protein
VAGTGLRGNWRVSKKRGGRGRGGLEEIKVGGEEAKKRGRGMQGEGQRQSKKGGQGREQREKKVGSEGVLKY